MATDNWLSGVAAGMTTSMADQLQRLRAISDVLGQQTSNLRTLASGSGGSALGTIGSVLGGGFGLSPLISGLLSAFGGGGDPSAPPALLPFLRPAPVRLNAGISAEVGATPFAVDFGQGGGPRPVNLAPAQITVQVQAMDSRSFLDHSHDIARAVRQAMLETTVLNDVIREV